MTTTSKRRTLLIGWRGGVGTAALALLADHPLGRALAAKTELLLIDAEPGTSPAPPLEAEILPARRLLGEGDLAALVRRHEVSRVLDLGASNTLGSARACAAAGADYLSTCYDPLHYRADGPPTGPRLMHGARDLLPDRRPRIAPGSHLIASGMNPGIVSALVLAGLEQFAAREDVPPSELDLYALLLTEIDSTAASAPPPEGAFPMSWSPEHCLSEILEPDALVVREGEIEPLGHPPTGARYASRCGDGLTRGFAVPHEELVWLGARFPACEVGYLYQVPAAAEAALRRHPERPAEAWETHALIPPRTPAEALTGRDCVGVLLCSRTRGELWLGFDTSVQEGRRWGTNATELQVAAGVLAGWAQLGEQPGLHLVEELDWRRFLRDAEAILGPAAAIRDPSAPARPLASRRISDGAAEYRGSEK